MGCRSVPQFPDTRSGSFFLQSVHESRPYRFDRLRFCLIRNIQATPGSRGEYNSNHRPARWNSKSTQGLRECIGEHTCDKRGKRSVFEAKFPEFEIEKDLTEEDVLWLPDWRESLESQDERAKGVLDMIFSDSESVCEFIS
jgi:hypothetical protein